MLDPDSGGLFWYNGITGLSSWELPAAEAAGPSSVRHDHSPSQHPGNGTGGGGGVAGSEHPELLEPQ